MPALGGLAGVAHSQGGAEDGRLDVVHRNRVARQDRLHVTIPNEPFEVGSSARMHQRRAHDPDEITTPSLLFSNPGSQLLVIDRPLTAHFRGHEAELVSPMPSAQKTLGRDHEALGFFLRLSHGDELAPLEPPGLDGLESPAPLGHNAVHPGAGWRHPGTVHLDVGGKVRCREEALRQHSVGRQRCKTSLGRPGEGRLAEIGHCTGSGGCVHTRVKLGQLEGVFKRCVAGMTSIAFRQGGRVLWVDGVLGWHCGDGRFCFWPRRWRRRTHPPPIRPPVTRCRRASCPRSRLRAPRSRWTGCPMPWACWTAPPCSGDSRRLALTRHSTICPASWSPTGTTSRWTREFPSGGSAAARTSEFAGSRFCWTAFPRPFPMVRASSPMWTSPTLTEPRSFAAPAPRCTAMPLEVSSHSRPSERLQGRSPSGSGFREALARATMTIFTSGRAGHP